MAIRKDVLMTKIVSAFAKGCDGAEIEDSAADWFHDHYYGWIDGVKAIGNSPEDAWADYGRDFMNKFMEIGRRAAAEGGPVTAETLNNAAISVERESECPYCPLKP